MAVPQLVKDVMKPALELEANKIVRDARQILDHKNVSLGVIISGKAYKPPIMVERDQLEKMSALQRVDETPAEDLHWDPINQDDLLHDIIPARAKDLVVNPRLSGFVVKAGSTVVGVLSRNKFAVVALLSEYYSTVSLSSSEVATLVSREESDRTKVSASSRSSRDRAYVSRLEGSAITPLLLYVCLFDCERLKVAYYNPNPNKRPRCTQSHEMHLIRVYTP